MSATRTISETVSSLVPSVERSPTPDPDLYRCRNCGRDVEDGEACANCSSTNLRPLYL